MSSSGKSKNRLYEYNRGRGSGGGHGIYAEAGKRDRKLEMDRRANAAAWRAVPNDDPSGTMADLRSRRDEKPKTNAENTNKRPAKRSLRHKPNTLAKKIRERRKSRP